MKLRMVLAILGVFVAVSANANVGSRMVKAVRLDYDLQKYRARDLTDETFAQQVNFIYAVLSRTVEKHSHQFGGETDNEVWVSEDGHAELVVRFDRDEHGNKIDGTGAHVTDCKNMGSYNYFHPDEQPLGHFSGDIFPWLKLGNCEDDPTTPNERVEAYMLDIRDGVDFVLNHHADFSLTEQFQFQFKEKGQSETIDLFLMALRLGDFDATLLGQMSSENLELRDSFLTAIETGFKELMKVPNERLR